MAQATISYFKDNRGEEQLKGKTGLDIYIGLPPVTGKPRPAAVYN